MDPDCIAALKFRAFSYKEVGEFLRAHKDLLKALNNTND